LKKKIFIIGFILFVTWALPSQAAISDNTTLGTGAGENLTTGTENIMLGQGGNITSGAGNILIGNNLIGTTATNSAQLDIGDVFLVTGINAPSTSAATIEGTLTVDGNLTANGTGNSLGTITSGTWNGAAIGAAYGGTGQNSSSSTGVAQVSSGAWSFSTALANGTTATTQSQGDYSSKLSTDAFFLQNTRGGFLNKIRNGDFSMWQRGTSSLATSSTGKYTADGWIVAQSGAQGTCSQSNNGFFDDWYVLSCSGATSNTDTTVSQRIESYVASPLGAGNAITIQFEYYQNTGSSVTPKLSTCYASSQDNFGTCTSDLSSTSLTSCASGGWCEEAYTFTPVSSASNGYAIMFDCNTALASAQQCEIGRVDVRVTPNVTSGINSSPPYPEFRDPSDEASLDYRYFWSSYPLGTAPGTANSVGNFWYQVESTNGENTRADLNLRLPDPMRAAPTVTFYAEDSGISGDVWNRTTNTDIAASTASISNVGITGVTFATQTTGQQILFQLTASAEL